MLEGLALRANGVVNVHVEEPLPDLLIDRTRIQHVLYALTDNAVDASEGRSASPLIQIDVVADQYSVETSIIDTGDRGACGTAASPLPAFLYHQGPRHGPWLGFQSGNHRIA
jgi:C4-dicarboxylate-specific signal transduction histidine kinase